MILESIAVGSLLLFAWHQAGKAKQGELTPERKAIFQAALESLEDSGKLRDLADVFEKEGCTMQAEVLRKRAKLREMPKAFKDQRHEAFRKGMSSANYEGILGLAKMFEDEGAVGAANALRGYAAGIKAGSAVPFTPPPAPPPAPATAPAAPSVPSAPTGSSTTPAAAAMGAPPATVAATAASTGQAILPSTSPTGQVAQTADNPSGLPVTHAPTISATTGGPSAMAIHA
jgi:hypothetical protein